MNLKDKHQHQLCNIVFYLLVFDYIFYILP